MTRLLKLVERVKEDLNIFLNDKGMTNDQAFKIAEQLILENIEEENI